MFDISSRYNLICSFVVCWCNSITSTDLSFLFLELHLFLYLFCSLEVRLERSKELNSVLSGLLVERARLELATPCVQSRCSPN